MKQVNIHIQKHRQLLDEASTWPKSVANVLLYCIFLKVSNSLEFENELLIFIFLKGNSNRLKALKAKEQIIKSNNRKPATRAIYN